MIAITGGAGFIGSCLAWKFNELGRSDLLLIDDRGTEPPKSENLRKRKYADYLEKDEFVKALSSGRLNRDLEAIFHLGACTDTTETNKEFLWDTNYDYSRRLAEWAVKEGKRFIYASSAATYGDGERGYSDAKETIPKLKPLNLYGLSKQVFDEWVLENKLEKKFVGLKFFNVFGPNEYHKGEMRSMVHKGYGQIKKDGHIRLFKSHRPGIADGEQKRDFVYVKDVLAVILWFWSHPQAAGIYNLGTGKAETWLSLVRAIFKAVGKPEQIEFVEMPAAIRDKYQYWTEADLSNLRRAGCAHPFLALEEAVRDYVQNHLEKPDPYL
ncbi:MAG: ADP-glyceromanno-heptose 6-epimerase [Candidatus Omnitrophica bacterium]|nr:ADP-glyceromanno-heptose 6-epimerase [Candidatus Omnitrophota bacterium]